MDTQTFIEQMKRLDDRFSKGRELAPSTAQVYKDELYRIPSEAFRDIVRRLIKYNRAYPTPGEIDELWRDWQQTHPDKVFDDKKGTPCDPCNSKGYFDFEFVPKWIRQHPDFKKKDPIWYEGVVNCAHCKTYPMAKKVVGSMFLSDFDTEEYMRLRSTALVS